MVTPRSASVFRCARVAGWWSMRSSIAGARTIGAAVESAIRPSKSSARPSASRAMAAAVAGATIRRSAFLANPTWPVKSSCHGREWVGVHRRVGDGGERERLNEALRGLCHHDVDVCSRLHEEAGDRRRLVGGNAAGHSEEDRLDLRESLISALP